VILLGNAPTNQTAPLIEGGIIPGSYGGPNPADNSGVFMYVRIEFPGYRFQLNNEVNGLTMGGVGSGTTIENVQVSYSFDDSFEWFGGTVDAHRVVAFGGTDDEFDTDFGYSGRIQFAFGLKDPDMWDPTGETNGFESDNEGTPSRRVPQTSARISNATLLGAYRVDSVAARTGNKFQYAAVLRRGTQFSIFNSFIGGFPGGPSLRDTITYNDAINDVLRVRNTSIAATDGVTFPVVHGSGSVTSTQAATWFNTAAYGNLGGTAARGVNALGLVNLNDLSNPDPRPGTGTELATSSVEFTNLNALAGGFFTPTSYRGAFDPSLPLAQQWTAGWTNYTPQYSTKDVEGEWNMVSVPAVSATADPAVVFPGQSGVTFEWNNAGGGSYGAATGLVPGRGYWVKYPSKKTVAFGGTKITGTITVSAAEAGWVLIGGLSVPVRSIQTTGTGTLDGLQFKWIAATQSYQPVDLTNAGADDLLPGEGAWVKVTGPCTITLVP
jgi:hypothetical protein